jgi:hypothetical protein
MAVEMHKVIQSNGCFITIAQISMVKHEQGSFFMHSQLRVNSAGDSKTPMWIYQPHLAELICNQILITVSVQII